MAKNIFLEPRIWRFFNCNNYYFFMNDTNDVLFQFGMQAFTRIWFPISVESFTSYEVALR